MGVASKTSRDLLVLGSIRHESMRYQACCCVWGWKLAEERGWSRDQSEWGGWADGEQLQGVREVFVHVGRKALASSKQNECTLIKTLSRMHETIGCARFGTREEAIDRSVLGACSSIGSRCRVVYLSATAETGEE